ncbi:MAG: hypothetical protein IJ092_12165 [Atopobiaceae bacterium]|nr:hypothetical protein [Atopobiaceae bacterium]MBR1828122.1 hypothetical protein [Atopobiaceae bacterium]
MLFAWAIATPIAKSRHRQIKLAPLQTRHFAFGDYLDAYRWIDDNREQVMKVIIDVDPEA